MKKNIKYTKIAVIILLATSLFGCDNFLDVNKNPNKQTTPILSTLASSCIEKSAHMHYYFSSIANRYSQHTSAVSVSQIDQYYENRMPNAWYHLYANLLSDLKELKDLAKKQNAAHFLGISQVLTAFGIGTASDFWGSIPYTEALKGNENFTPAYDTQESIYKEVYKLLDEGISNLKKTNTKFGFTTNKSTFDLLYKGDTKKWIKYAYALKARFLNHWSKTSLFDANAVREAVSNSFTGVSDDANFYYNEQEFNPYYNIVLSNNTGNLTIMFSDYFIRVLNDDIYHIGMVDPRLSIIADTTTIEHNGVYTGYLTGSSTKRPTDLYFTEKCWHFGITSPLEMATYAEVQYILSEVEVNAGNKSKAFAAYSKALNANMSKLAVSAKNIAAYIKAEGVDNTNITIANVMKQKYIAMFLQFESWTDIRRYNYGVGNTTYKEFSLPVDHNPELGGKFIRRVLYPLTEENRNRANVDAAKGSNYGLLKRLSWDK